MVKITINLLRRQIPEYWRRYVERYQNELCIPPRYVYLRGWVGEDRRKTWIVTQNSPHTQQSMEQQPLTENGAYKRYIETLNTELIEPIQDWIVFEGDRVEILVGRDKGKQGIVRNIVHERNWVFVESLNIQTKYLNSNVWIEEMPLDVSSEIKLVDPTTERAAEKVEWRYTEEGQKIRVSFPSEVELPLPESDTALPDGIQPNSYTEKLATDTVQKQLDDQTYKPSLKTFAEEVLESMAIKDDKKRHKTYWY